MYLYNIICRYVLYIYIETHKQKEPVRERGREKGNKRRIRKEFAVGRCIIFLFLALTTPRVIIALFKEHISVVEIWLRITLLYIIAFNVYKIPSCRY